MKLQITRQRPPRNAADAAKAADMDDLSIRTQRYVTLSDFDQHEEVVIRRDDGQALAIRLSKDGFEVRHFGDDETADANFSQTIQIHSGYPPVPEVIE